MSDTIMPSKCIYEKQDMKFLIAILTTFTLAISLFTTSCTRKHNADSEITPIVEEFLQFKIDTIAVQTESAYDFPGMWVQLPFNRFSIFKDDCSHLYVGYDPRIHDIWRFDVTANKFLEKIGLKYRGEDGLADLASILYHSPDSLFMLEVMPDRLWIMDTKTRKRNLLLDFEDKTQDDPRFDGIKVSRSQNNSAPMFFVGSRIYFPLRSSVSSTDYSYPLLGFYELTTDSIGTIDIHFPNEYQGVNYGYYNWPNSVFER